MFMIDHADTDNITHTKDQIIQFLAFFTFSSSHHESRYIIQLIISAITATTATNCIVSQIKFEITSNHLLSLTHGFDGFIVTHSSSHHGSPQQFTTGAWANALG